MFLNPNQLINTSTHRELRTFSKIWHGKEYKIYRTIYCYNPWNNA